MNPATQADSVARALVRRFEHDNDVDELFVGATEIQDALLSVWAPDER